MSPFPLRRTRRRAEATGLGRQPAPPCAWREGLRASRGGRRDSGSHRVRLTAIRAPAPPAHSMLGEASEGAVTSAPSEVLAGGFAEGARRLFQALLLGSGGRPLPAPQRVLGTVPDPPRPRPELTR